MTAQSPAGARLMLLDTYGLVYAAFFAMKDRPLTTSRGTRIEAAYVFTTTLISVRRSTGRAPIRTSRTLATK